MQVAPDEVAGSVEAAEALRDDGEDTLARAADFVLAPWSPERLHQLGDGEGIGAFAALDALASRGGEDDLAVLAELWLTGPLVRADLYAAAFFDACEASVED